VSDWTIVIDRSIDLDKWAQDVTVESVAALHDWLVTCRDDGPPADAWLVEMEDGYRYWYWLSEVNVTVEFISIVLERWMAVTRVD
jgi:hypothetical protein